MRKGRYISLVAAEGRGKEQKGDSLEQRSIPEGGHIETQPTSSTPDREQSEGSGQGQRYYLEDLVNQTPTAILALDERCRVVDINPAATEKLHCTVEGARGRVCSELLYCRNLNGTLLCGTSACPLTRVLEQQKPIVGEELLLGPTEETATEYSVEVTPISTKEGPLVVFSARDMSALKVANRVRANFVSMVSHELRTPLNSVQGFIDLLMQGHMGKLSEEQGRYLGYAQEGVLQLIAIVEDILFMTRSDSGQFMIKPEEVNLRVLARQVVNSLRITAEKNAVVLEKDIPMPTPRLYADPQKMKQVLNNLVTNAIKFTPPGGRVTIRARPQSDEFVLIEVVDTGFGIALEDQPHVFERFYQSNHALQSRMGGYGLGLSIARLIVEQHGGKIDFESQQGGEGESGTRFYFTAPLVRARVESK